MDPRMAVAWWWCRPNQDKIRILQYPSMRYNQIPLLRHKWIFYLMSTKSSSTASRSTWLSYPSKSQPTKTSPLRDAPPSRIMCSIALSKLIQNPWSTMAASRSSSTTTSSILCLCQWLMLTDWSNKKFLNKSFRCSASSWFTPSWEQSTR